MEETARSRIRLKFARLKEAAGLTHLEQLRELRGRALASGLKWFPAKPGGDSPRMAFGPAIGAGHESSCEYADLYLREFVKAEEAAEALRRQDDGRFCLLRAERIPVFFPAIEASVNAAEYRLEGEFPPAFGPAALDAFLALETRPYEKVKGNGERRTVDARAALLAASCDAAAGLLKLTLRLDPGRTLKPETMAGLLAGGEPELRRVARQELYWLNSQGKLEVF
jgi:radical SAM-linked protein